MENIADLKLKVLDVLNYPLIVLGKSSITLSLLFLNLFLALAFLFLSKKAKDWCIDSLSKRQGINISNWRAIVTLTYYAILGLGLMGILQSTGLDLSFFTVLTEIGRAHV
jgi:small-conductance mechanosensitive channel